MSLRDELERRDREVVVGRERELALIADFLTERSPYRLLALSGPAGVGKSQLVRELARLAVERGLDVISVHRLDDLLHTTTPRVVLIDPYDHSEDDDHLRDVLLPALPAGSRVVLSSRERLPRAWTAGLWSASTLRLPLGPLSAEESEAYLLDRGISDTGHRARLLRFADGLPLALSIGASLFDGSIDGGLDGHDSAELDLALLDHLVGLDVLLADHGGHHDVLAVAALAPAVDAALLGAALPGRDADADERWLRSLDVAVRVGNRVTLRSHVRRLLAQDLRRTRPDCERALRVRIVEHLSSLALEGRPTLMGEIREVLAPDEDQGSRASDARERLQVTPANTDDLIALTAHAIGSPAYAAWLSAVVDVAPGHVIAVRRDDQVRGLAVWFTTDECPEGLEDDPVVTWWRDQAAAMAPDGAALLHLATEIVGEDDLPEAVRADVRNLLNTEVIAASGLANPRWWFVMAPTQIAAYADTCGGTSIGDLPDFFGDDRLAGMAIDFGPEGVIGAMRSRAHAAAPAADVGLSQRESTSTSVREALRCFHQPLLLAGHPWAQGSGVEERADAVRRRLREGIVHAFGGGPGEQQQLTVLELGYLDPAGGHARAMRTLHVSRTTYFRRLREATETLAAYLE